MTTIFTNEQLQSQQPCCNPWGDKSTIISPGRQQGQQQVPETDVDIAKEMNSLTFEEREKVFDDVHGVAKAPEETPEFVAKHIRALDTYVDSIRQKHLQRAFFLRPELKNDTNFKLMFLRAEEFNARNAAERMGRYFDWKRTLFGEEKLVKDITIDDLNEDDLNVFRSGCFVELPFRNQSGQPIQFLDVSKLDFNAIPPNSYVRAGWYMLNTTAQDEIAQKKGICDVSYCSGMNFRVYQDMGRLFATSMACGKSIDSVPFRYSSFHFCMDDTRMDFLIKATQGAALSRHARLRFRLYLGSEIENEYKLMTYGIPAECLLQKAKMGDTTLHYQYIERRRVIDNELEENRARKEAGLDVILYPEPNDVLIGRGVPYTTFPGNKRWNDLIHANLAKYTASRDAFEKTCISMDVVKTIHDVYKGRFLQRTPKGWKILDDSSAREKAAIAFRSRVKAVSSGSKSTGFFKK